MAVRDHLQTVLLVLVLLAVGALLGSFWLEWRHARGSQDATPDVAGSRAAADENRPRVEVLNGMGERGAAREVTSYLRERGFDVVYFGNAPRFDQARTEVLDRSGSPALADSVARALGLDSARVRLDAELYLDATVILGTDWRERLTGRSP
ncbi:MAG: LytR C-terminal domain-containing protein [Gemmatimonadota bacterium]